MQWTQELNALLNQCVFASSYDFETAGELFCQQATKLRLWTGEEELELSANQCQERWMALNPTEEDDDDDSDEQEDKGEDPETATDDAVEEEDGYVVVPDGGPRLELSLSDAELDLLLSTLPPSEEPEDASSSTSADAKDRQSRSEMQWVLAFLTDPDGIASVDAEAKNLMATPEKHDDDNYQVFLQDLQDANLIVPAPISAGKGKLLQTAGTANGIEDHDEGSSSDESEEDWERTRQAMKRSMKLR
ncbi:hypothetical protein PRIC2_012586 [Phytophthora ramorum]